MLEVLGNWFSEICFSSHGGIKLLEHAMKVVKRIFRHIIWQQINIVDMQFGFVKGKRTNDNVLL